MKLGLSSFYVYNSKKISIEINEKCVHLNSARCTHFMIYCLIIKCYI